MRKFFKQQRKPPPLQQEEKAQRISKYKSNQQQRKLWSERGTRWKNGQPHHQLSNQCLRKCQHSLQLPLELTLHSGSQLLQDKLQETWLQYAEAL